MEYAREYASALSPRSLMRKIIRWSVKINLYDILYGPFHQWVPQSADGSSSLLKRCAFRVCTHNRSSRKGVVARTLDDLFTKAWHALSLTSEVVTLVLEEDGTVVENEEFFQSLETNTQFMVLEEGQRWTQAKGVSGVRRSNKKGVAKVTFDLYKLNPKDFIGCLSIKATFYEMYTMSYDIKCMGAKHVLKKMLRCISYAAQVAGQFLLYGSTYVLQYTVKVRKLALSETHGTLLMTESLTGPVPGTFSSMLHCE